MNVVTFLLGRCYNMRAWQRYIPKWVSITTCVSQPNKSSFCDGIKKKEYTNHSKVNQLDESVINFSSRDNKKECSHFKANLVGGEGKSHILHPSFTTKALYHEFMVFGHQNKFSSFNEKWYKSYFMSEARPVRFSRQNLELKSP